MAGGLNYVIGVDVGGTNTDAVILCGKTVVGAAKRPTEEDKTRGVFNAIRAALDDGLNDDLAKKSVIQNVSRVCIGTTHFVNAVVSRDRSRLARVAVVRLCGSASRYLPPFSDFPEDLRNILCGGVYMVDGGFEYDLRSIAELDEEELRRVAEEISNSNPPIRNVVICGIFSPHDDPAGSNNQERRAAQIITSKYPGITCTLSHQIGLLGLLERENAAILNEALRPLARQTIQAFREALGDLGLNCPFFLTQNDGTLVSEVEAVDFPVFTFSSGPTNSMRGAAFLSGLSDAIVVDIGGTTTDIGVIKNGFPREASSQRKVGGVRTNFSMPDVLSLELGGGSTCIWDETSSKLTLGPSVGHRLITEGLCFGGSTCTATDVAVATGVAPRTICRVSSSSSSILDSLNPILVYKALSCIREMIERGIDSVKTDRADVPVVLVGGGSCLVDKSIRLHGVSSLIVPKTHWDVANAIGAGLGTVGATIDTVESLEVKEEGGEGEEEKEEEKIKKARLRVLEKTRERAISEVVKKGADPSKVYIHSEDVVDVAYVAKKVRIRVKAIGPLQEDIKEKEEEEVVNGGANVTAKESQRENKEKEGETTKCANNEDNLHWPFASEKDKEKDAAAGLPIPHVEGERWSLSADDVECVAVGAGLLGCGGGGDPNVGRLVALRQLDQGRTITVINPLRVKESEVGLVTCGAFMGAPVIISEKMVAGNETRLALDALKRVLASGIYDAPGGWEDGGKKGNERVTVNERDIGDGRNVWTAEQSDLLKIDVSSAKKSQQISHLFCAEIGGANSFEPLVMGAELGLPVLDADGMGRAFPELQMYSPLIYGHRPYPSTVADNKGEVIACTHVGGAKDLEDFFRVECVRMGMSCGICLGVLTLQDVLNTAVLLSMSMAWQLGRAVKRARVSHTSVLEAIAEQQNGVILIVGKVTDVVHVTEAGFGRLEAVIEGLDIYKGHKVKVLAKNENYIVRYVEEGEDGVVMACTPDLICVVDSDTGYPITTEMVRYGLRVGVLALPVNPRMLTPRAMRVVGPAAFGLHYVTYHPPRPLPRSISQIGKSLTTSLT